MENHMLIMILATLTTDIVLLRIYKAMGWEEAFAKWFQSRMKPWMSVACVLAFTVLVTMTIQMGLNLFQAPVSAKPIAMGVGLGICLSLIPLTGWK